MSVKSLAIKGTIGLISVGGASGLVAHQLLSKQENKQKNSIGDKLEREKYILLSQDSQTWSTILDKYKEVTASKTNFKFDDFDGNKPSGSDKEAVDILKDHCQKTLSKKETDADSNAVFEKARKWCVVPISVTEILDKQGFKALDTGATKTGWEAKIKGYKTAAAGVQKIANLTLSTDANTTIEKDYTDIKEKCRTISTVKNHDATFEETLKGFELWCANKE
ncbi:hypothetical protein A6V39_03655 [Candidatus Mycoplasma haematobovis]|uniref:Uncharacterized protein n=1 Tax=Candidatus Mycoplasma haematobovis TaxID=432608 RepID=A0A1A9QBM1_9MOLU|nr:hypothetical protein [Candidatus Mycoplasma haematobovis]OAL09982.1 hypothetical protein A6V39_03655 [Candidatus Mycoplasma haematobovis]